MTETIVTKPYEILIRFNCEPGEMAGGLRGVSLAQKRFMVDEAGTITGRVDSRGPDLPQDFPADQLVSLLGASFVDFEAHHRAVLAELEALKDAQDS